MLGQKLFCVKWAENTLKAAVQEDCLFLFCDNLEDQKAYDMVAWWHGLVYGC